MTRDRRLQNASVLAQGAMRVLECGPLSKVSTANMVATNTEPRDCRLLDAMKTQVLHETPGLPDPEKVLCRESFARCVTP
jgi:hypothetical protein